MNKESGKFTNYIYDPSDKYSISDNIVISIYEDRKEDCGLVL